MSEQVTARLAQLRQEFQAGEEQLRDLVLRENALRATLLRISGAIQVLEELAEPADTDGRPAAGPDAAPLLSVG